MFIKQNYIFHNFKEIKMQNKYFEIEKPSYVQSISDNKDKQLDEMLNFNDDGLMGFLL